MQSLVPRAIPIIEFGAKGDNCAVAKYKKTKQNGSLLVNCSHILKFFSRFLNTFRAKIFGKIPGLIRARSHYRVSRQSDSNPKQAKPENTTAKG